jgi:hypothetical protein
MKQPFNLDDLPRQLPYSAPEKYFDELPSRIQNRIKTKTADDSGYEWISGISFPRLRLALASLALAVTGSLVVVLNQPVTQNYMSLENLQQGEVAQYMAINELTPDLDDLATLSALDNSLTHSLPSVQVEDLTDMVDEEEIEDILL